MKTEHLQNVHLGWVTAGWLISAAVTSLVVIALAGLGLAAPEGSTAGMVWGVLAVVIGFYVGGMFTGFRSTDAPILHGIAIGIFSLVAWLVINLIASTGLGTTWAALTPTGTAAALLLQMAAAVAGALTGRSIEMKGGPDVTE